MPCNPVLSPILFPVLTFLGSPFDQKALTDDFYNRINKDIEVSFVGVPGHASAVNIILKSFKNDGVFGKEVQK